MLCGSFAAHSKCITACCVGTKSPSVLTTISNYASHSDHVVSRVIAPLAMGTSRACPFSKNLCDRFRERRGRERFTLVRILLARSEINSKTSRGKKKEFLARKETYVLRQAAFSVASFAQSNRSSPSVADAHTYICQ